MKSIAFAVALTISAARGVADDWPLKDLSSEAELAYLALSRAQEFAFGPIGFGGFTAEGDLAVRILVRHPKAIAIFQIAAKRPGPGGLYALAALHAFDGKAYKESLTQFKATLSLTEPGKKITLQAACIAHDELITDVLTKLDAGTYDPFIPKPK